MPSLPSNWTPQAATALSALARTAIHQAEGAPHQWVNPTPLHSKVRYIRGLEQGPPIPPEMLFEIYEAYEATARPMYFAIREHAQEFLFQCWVHELQSSESNRNTEFVEQLTINNTSVSGEMVTKELHP